MLSLGLVFITEVNNYVGSSGSTVLDLVIALPVVELPPGGRLRITAAATTPTIVQIANARKPNRTFFFVPLRDQTLSEDSAVKISSWWVRHPPFKIYRAMVPNFFWPSRRLGGPANPLLLSKHVYLSLCATRDDSSRSPFL